MGRLAGNKSRLGIYYFCLEILSKTKSYTTGFISLTSVCLGSTLMNQVAVCLQALQFIQKKRNYLFKTILNFSLLTEVGNMLYKWILVSTNYCWYMSFRSVMIDKRAFHLGNMKLGQEVTVGKGQLIPIKKIAFWHSFLFSVACVYLFRQRFSQIVIQLLQSLC